ncbi:MAG: cell envelope integrity protein TolA [Desulfocapsaceae bacterium]|nr:cell envelope integrity protein TolA [Desulfocapsaceae bacterium]
MHNNEWKLPLNLAIGFHVLLVLVALYMPELFHTRPIPADIYSVNLVSVAELGPKAGGSPKQEAAKQEAAKPEPAQSKAETAKPEVKIKPIDIKPPPPPPEPVHIQKPVVKPAIAPTPVPPPANDAISLKPLKRPIPKDVVDDTVINERIRKLELQQKREQEEQKRELELKQKREQEVEKNKELENIRKQRIAEAAKAEREAENARKTADELKNLIHSSGGVKNTVKDSTGNQAGSGEGNSEGTATRSGGTSSALDSQYQAAIYKRIQQFWSLPDIKKWDPSLTAVVVITINQDGSISNQFFEKRSGDSSFDQYVEKTLHDCVPLPPIPGALRKSQYEIGLRFKPTGIQ